MMKTEFEPSPRFSTCFLGIVMTDLIRISSPYDYIHVWCRLNFAPYVKYAKDIATITLLEMTEYLKTTNAIPVYNIVVQPEGQNTQAWGIVIFR